VTSLARAIATGDVAELPSRREEDWRWTDIRGLVRTIPPPSAPFEGLLDPGLFDELADDVLTVTNGRLPGSIQTLPLRRGALALRIVGRGRGAHAVSIPPLRVDAGEVALLETYEGSDGYLADTDLAIEVAAGASLERIVLCDEAPEAVSVSRADVVLEPGARFAQTVISSGARRQRIETQVRHLGGGASVRLDSVYLLDAQRHADLTTVVVHERPGGLTDQLTKGVVKDQARGVFRGRITVAEGADMTDARMAHHALVLSDHGEVDAKPELEIFADDVACAHGNTVGALDADALFYAMQRGLSEADARALLTRAFLFEVVDRIGHSGAREKVRAWLSERVGAAP
jgi:Fe-S cluster assembly protein SufD